MEEALQPRQQPGELVLTAELEAARAYAEHSRAPATLRAYRRDFQAFRAWCDKRGLDALPAQPATVAAFLAAQADSGLKPATIQRRSSAIAAWHRLAAQPNPADSEQVALVLSGIRRSRGVAPQRKHPLRTGPLGELLRAVDAQLAAGTLGELAARRDRALLLVGFAGALRRSELCALNVEDLDLSTDRGLLVTIARSKTDQEGAGDLVAVHRGDHQALCAVRAVTAWLEAAAITDGAVFRRMHRGDTVASTRLSAQSVALIVKRHAKAAGLPAPELAAHSLRAGFATTAAEQGHAERQIARVTRHRSMTVLRGYIRPATAFEDSAKVL